MEPAAVGWPVRPDVVRGQVESVVSSVVRPDELDECSVVLLAQGEEPQGDFTHENFCHEAGDGQPNLWVRVSARDEEWWYGAWNPSGSDWGSFLSAFADELEARVSETSFGWGQRRMATLPEGMKGTPE